MKISIKSFIVGFLVAFIGTASVFAADGIKSAYFNSNKVIFDSKELNIGAQQMISVVKDGEEYMSNYMPVRGVLEAMGYTVNWDGQNNAVIVTSPNASQTVATSFGLNQIIGYWAYIFPYDDGSEHLDGFYFAKDGTGLMFHPSEGAFPITSYSISDNKLYITFLNTENEPVEWSVQILAIYEKQLILKYSDSYTPVYERMQAIESISHLGSYTVTQLDGATLDISAP